MNKLKNRIMEMTGIKGKVKPTTTEKVQLVVTTIVRAILIAAILWAVFSQRWMVLFHSSLALFLTFLPSIIERNHYISIPIELEITFIVFICASLFLGEVYKFYQLFWWWDLLLHTLSGIILGFIGFIILFVMYSEKKIRASPGVVALFTFCFAVALGAVWEIMEFAIDSIGGFNMQKSGLVDTMWDLIVDTVGGMLSAGLGYIYLKSNKGYLINRLIKSHIEKKKRILTK